MVGCTVLLMALKTVSGRLLRLLLSLTEQGIASLPVVCPSCLRCCLFLNPVFEACSHINTVVISFGKEGQP